VRGLAHFAPAHTDRAHAAFVEALYMHLGPETDRLRAVPKAVFTDVITKVMGTPPSPARSRE
jgi:hypothetical protein